MGLDGRDDQARSFLGANLGRLFFTGYCLLELLALFGIAATTGGHDVTPLSARDVIALIGPILVGWIISLATVVLLAKDQSKLYYYHMKYYYQIRHYASGKVQ